MRFETLAFGAYVASLNLFFQRLARLPRWPAYVLTVGLFLWICSQFYIPGKGFTYLIRFGSEQSDRYLPVLKTINHYEEENSSGYDAQSYAQIAMQPRLSDPDLKVDSLAYRARRILFAWIAYGLALGDPARALHIYSVENIACWLFLAVILLRWFPATTWGNFFRWFCVLFSAGMSLSVRGALVDGPSLLLIAAGVALVEAGRPWWSAIVLGIGSLGKETNLLAGIALPIPTWRDGPRGWVMAIARGLVVVLPIGIWIEILWFWLGNGGDPGQRNFAWPFSAYFEKWVETWAQLPSEGIGSLAQWSVLLVNQLTPQWLFFALRPRWRDPWWRVAAVYSVLMACLGPAVWEGYPGAASRVLLPMTLAFNILVPRSRNLGWWALLLVGNLTVIFSPDFLKPPGREDFHVRGDRELIMIEKTGQTVEAKFSNTEWFLPERSRFQYWRWSRGSASVVFNNPQPFPVVADISFGLKSNDERRVTVMADSTVLWSGDTQRDLREVTFRAVLLPPGETTWRFESDKTPESPDTGDLRRLAFSLRNLKIDVKSRAPEPLPPTPPGSLSPGQPAGAKQP